MVKLTTITLAFIASAVQCAVLKTEELPLQRSARSPVSNGPQLHTQNWSGLARSADGQNTIFSGASAAADQGLPTAGSAFSLAAAGPLATSQDGQSSDSKTKHDAEKPSISTRFGGDYDDQQSVVGGGKFTSGGFKESHFSYYSGGGARFGGNYGIAHNRGFGPASSASSSAQSGGVKGYHGFGQGNLAFGSDSQAQGGYQQGNNLNGGFEANSAASSQSGAVGRNYGAGIGHGYGGSYIESSSHGKNFESQGGLQQTQNQQQFQGFASGNAQAQSNDEKAQDGQQSVVFGSSSNQQKSNSFENGVSSHELQNSGFGAHGGFQDSNNQQSQSAGFGPTSSSSAPSGAGIGDGGRYTESSGHDSQQLDNQKQTQGLGSANTGAQSNEEEAQNGQQSGGFGSSRNQQKSNSISSHEFQNSGFGADGGFQDSSNQQVQSAALGSTSSSSSQSGAFGGNNGAGIGNGYGGHYTESSGHGIQQANNQKQSQELGSANVGVSDGGEAKSNQQQSSYFGQDLGGHKLQSSSGGSQYGQESFGSSLHAGGSSQAGGLGSSSFEGQSALKGALDLASQGLQASGQPGCSTCGKSSLALSNAKSHSGSAVALSISG